MRLIDWIYSEIFLPIYLYIRVSINGDYTESDLDKIAKVVTKKIMRTKAYTSMKW